MLCVLYLRVLPLRFRKLFLGLSVDIAQSSRVRFLISQHARISNDKYLERDDNFRVESEPVLSHRQFDHQIGGH